MAYLNQIDASFLHMESDRTPMHIAGLMIFKLPEGAKSSFVKDFYERALQAPVTLYPFNCKLRVSILSGIAPYWEIDEHIELDYHVRRSALPSPGGEKELGQLVERLHSHPLDMTRPPWEFHLIEGLENNRFALYFKAHHSAIDGMGAMFLLTKWLTDNPLKENCPVPWAMPNPKPRLKPDKIMPITEKSFFRRSLDAVKTQAEAAAELSNALYHMSKKSENPEGGMGSALHTPKTPFNVHVTPHRRVATQLFDINRFKKIGEQTGSTVNDVALATLGTSLRRYLDEQNQLPEHPLVASVPVALKRPAGEPGNAIAGFVCPLETHQDNPAKRLKNITAVTQRTKAQLQQLSKNALKQFSFVGIAPMMMSQVSGLGNAIPPIFNLVVSNVTAPRKPLYLNAAKLEAIYPISLLFDGYALNVTMVGQDNNLSMGFVGCRSANPSLQKLAVYTGEALDELEADVLGQCRQTKKSSDKVVSFACR